MHMCVSVGSALLRSDELFEKRRSDVCVDVAHKTLHASVSPDCLPLL